MKGLPGPEIAVLVREASERSGTSFGRRSGYLVTLRTWMHPEGPIDCLGWPTYRLYGLDVFRDRSERPAEAGGVGSRLHPDFAPMRLLGPSVLTVAVRSSELCL